MRVAFDSPAAVLKAWSVGLLLGVIGVAQLRVDTATSSFLDRRAPEWQVYERSMRKHGSDEFVVVAIETPVSMDAEALSAVERLSAVLEKTEGVHRVDSLATVPMVRGRDGWLEIQPVLGGEGPVDANALLKWAQEDAVAPGGLISADGRAFGINVLLDDNVAGQRLDVVSRIERVSSSVGARFTGVPIFRTAVNVRTQFEVILLGPLTLVVVGMGLWIVFGTAYSIAAVLLAPALAVLMTLGVMGFLGAPLSLSTMILPPILLALGCAYASHLLLACRDASDGASREKAALAVAPPILFSGLTTSLGFLAIASVGIDAIRELGGFGALGVMIETVAVLTVSPVLVARWRLGAIRSSVGRVFPRWAGALTRLIAKRRGAICLLWLGVAIGSFVGISRLHVTTDIIRWFPSGSAVRDDYERIRQELSGITPVQVLVEAPPGARVTDARVLGQIAELSEALSERDDVGRVLSIASVLDQVDTAVGGDWRGRDSDELVQQYLLMLAGLERVEDVLAADHTSAMIRIRMDDNRSSQIVELAEWVDRWWDRRGVPGYSADVTGIMFEFARSEEAIAKGQLLGLGLAAAAVGLVIWFLLGSLSAAFLAALPNALPLAGAFGVMGSLGVPLDAATVCLGSLALGIAVDDTIHVSAQIAEQRALGFEYWESVARALRRVLPPVVVSSAAIALGFAALGLSEFTLIRNLGLMTSGVVVVCMLADLTLLPVVLSWARERRPRGRIGN